jgi:hypothetical protein
MADPTIQRGTLSPFALLRLGEMLRGRYQLPATLPSGVYDLAMKLEHREEELNACADDPEVPGANHGAQEFVPTSKEVDYLRHAVEATRLAQHATSWTDKTRLVKLATAWVDLAKKARERGA